MPVIYEKDKSIGFSVQWEVGVKCQCQYVDGSVGGFEEVVEAWKMTCLS